ncbi:MAG: metallophosphoesterase, partial [Lachnospiraceae bacterium]|nr:metallophosphoesterase [Lachnospiraceae bacterium]
MKVLYILLFIAALFLLFVIVESIIEIRRIRITNYTYSNTKLPKEFNGYKILLLSDLHNCLYNEDIIIKTIKQEKPNGVFVAGDIITYGDKNKMANIRSIDLIKDISNYSDVYYAPGNHEMGYMIRKNKEWLEYEKYMLSTINDNIYFLDNKKIKLTIGNSSINIYGLHLTDGYYKRIVKKKLEQNVLEKLLDKTVSNEFNLLIAHNPDYFEEYSSWGADLVLSGHNHGGLLRLPLLGGVISPRLRIFPKYDYGLFELNKSTLILSGGLGAHSMKIRVNNKPEIVIVDFTK